jgi:hypothetical protein
MAFHAVLFTTGCILIFLGPPVLNLGQALVVGSLFASGAMSAQLWALAYTTERKLEGLTLGELNGHARLAAIGAELQTLTAALQAKYPALEELEVSRLTVDQIRERAIKRS